MLHIIEGANYVGKTTTLDILKKKKSFLTFVHPRFNDSKFFEFHYKEAVFNQIVAKCTYVPRDVVYQISHMTCLKYLVTVENKKVLLDRCFLSEMVYNELYEEKIYEEFLNILNKDFGYVIHLLTVKDDEALRHRIIERLKQDATKTYGIRDSSGFVPEPQTVEDKMKSQRMIEQKYLEFIGKYCLNVNIIDTSNLSKKQVAELIATY